MCILFSWNEKVAAGQSRPKSAPAFRPRFCFLDKKVLRFYAYFEEHAGLDDRAPEKRIRHVQILYHLEDDSISILEPRVQVNKNYLLQNFKEKKRFSSSLSYTYFWTIENHRFCENISLRKHTYGQVCSLYNDCTFFTFISYFSYNW